MAAKVDAQEKTNTFDPKRVEEIVAAVEEAIADRLSHKMEYVASCTAFNDAVKDAYNEGKLFGIPKKVLKAKIRERELKRELDGIADDFEDEQRETFEQLTQALGGLADLPLGKGAAAVDISQTEAGKRPRRKAPSAAEKTPGVKANPSPDASDDEKDLRPPHLRKGRVADEDTDAYKAGVAARKSGEGCSIPNDLQGEDRDLWHSGWSAADADHVKAASDNSAKLAQGITPLH